jgi:hypothetical protein
MKFGVRLAIIDTQLPRYLNKVFSVKKISLQAKLAYCAQTRRSNYAASLRLEGYDVTQEESKRELPSREAVLRVYRKSA